MNVLRICAKVILKVIFIIPEGQFVAQTEVNTISISSEHVSNKYINKCINKIAPHIYFTLIDLETVYRVQRAWKISQDRESRRLNLKSNAIIKSLSGLLQYKSHVLQHLYCHLVMCTV